jgi:hypothetical protein
VNRLFAYFSFKKSRIETTSGQKSTKVRTIVIAWSTVGGVRHPLVKLYESNFLLMEKVNFFKPNEMEQNLNEKKLPSG